MRLKISDALHPLWMRGSAMGSVGAWRRLFLSATWLVLAVLGSMSAARAQIVVTDIAGRQVQLERPATRIVLAAPSYFPALSLLTDAPADLVVGVGGLQDGNASEMERELAGKPRVGWMGSGTFSVERVLELKPDVVISAEVPAGPSHDVEAVLAKAGIAVVYVDFYFDPATNTVPSLEIIGQVVGAEARAKDYAAFHQGKIDHVLARLAAAEVERPRLLVNPRTAGPECCWASGSVGVLKYFEKLSVSNIAEGKVPGSVGQLSPEYVMESDPQVLVTIDSATGRDSLFGTPRSSANAVRALSERPLHPALRVASAARDGRVHVIDESLTYGPLNVLTVELFAKWIHPELFAGLEPQQTLDEINSRFLSRPLQGPFWASLDPATDKAGDRP